MSYADYWNALEALDRVPETYRSAAAAAESMAKEHRTDVEREHRSLTEDALHRESRAREALANGRRILDRVGLQTRLPASVKATESSTPCDTTNLGTAVAKLELAVSTLERHTTHSRDRRLADLRREEAQAAADRKKAAEERERSLEARRRAMNQRQTARRTFGMVAALVMVATSVAIALVTGASAVIGAGVILAVISIAASRRPVISTDEAGDPSAPQGHADRAHR